MIRRGATGAAILAATAGVAPACGLEVIGVGADTGAAEAGGGGDGGTIAVHPSEAGSGAVDGGDAGCGTACTPPPSEWTAASFETSAACPSGAPGQAVLEGPTPGSCGCTCGGATTNPCAQGSNITLQIGGEGTTLCGGGTLSGVNITGGCDSFRSNGAAIGSLACNNGKCQYVGATALASIGPQACGMTQKPAATTAAARGMLCTGAGACMVRAGDMACPAGFPTKHVVHAESGVKDTRTCSGCTCSTGPVTCTAPTITLYPTPDCQGTPTGAGAVNGSCVFIADSINGATHFKYASKPSAACTVATPSSVASGAFDPGPPITLCCP